MDQQVFKAYNSLTSKDQVVVDTMIITLYEKDLEVRSLAKSVTEQLGRAEKSDMELQQLRSQS